MSGLDDIFNFRLNRSPPTKRKECLRSTGLAVFFFCISICCTKVIINNYNYPVCSREIKELKLCHFSCSLFSKKAFSQIHKKLHSNLNIAELTRIGRLEFLFLNRIHLCIKLNNTVVQIAKYIYFYFKINSSGVSNLTSNNNYSSAFYITVLRTKSCFDSRYLFKEQKWYMKRYYYGFSYVGININIVYILICVFDNFL